MILFKALAMQIRFSFLFILPLAILISMPSILVGQECQTSHKRADRILAHPEIVNKVNGIDDFTELWIAQQDPSSRSSVVLTLPIVVHVVWSESSENISEAQIISQIDVLNQDFRKVNANFSNTPDAFKSIAADVEIEFCLASIDPDGNPTNGITRVQTSDNEIGETNDFFSSSAGGQDPWDNTKYINIWVCNQSEGSLGFATPPGTAFPEESDGIVIPSVYFGTIGTAAGSEPNHLGRTCTHEMGHYLNLEHVWGPNEGGCDEDDFVLDTPAQDFESEGCFSFPYTDDCTSGGNGINFQNYLDYSDDDCMTMFTEGQKLRMLAAVNGPRASLLNSDACSQMAGTNESGKGLNLVSVYPNPTSRLMTLTIDGDFDSRDLTWEVFDILGNRYLNFTLTSSGEVDFSALPTGSYFLTCDALPNEVKRIIILK